MRAGEQLAEAEIAVSRGFDHFDDRALAVHPRIRRILTTMIRPVPLYYQVLHWSDGTDLDELDRRLQAGAASEADFEGAVPAELRTIKCLHCGAEARVLVVDAGSALLAKSMTERLQRHAFRQVCPVCGGTAHPLVVESVPAESGPARDPTAI